MRTVVLLDLSRLVEGPNGRLGIAAEDETWRVLGALPPGRAVRLVVGDAQWGTLRLGALLQEHLADAGSVQIEGTQPVLTDYLEALLNGSTMELAS